MVSSSLQINYLYGDIHHLELGAGYTYVASFSNKPTWGFPIRIGYRYQKKQGGLFFKAAYTPLIIRANTFPFIEKNKLFVPYLLFGGIAVGWSF